MIHPANESRCEYLFTLYPVYSVNGKSGCNCFVTMYVTDRKGHGNNLYVFWACATSGVNLAMFICPSERSSVLDSFSSGDVLSRCLSMLKPS